MAAQFLEVFFDSNSATIAGHLLDHEFIIISSNNQNNSNLHVRATTIATQVMHLMTSRIICNES